MANFVTNIVSINANGAELQEILNAIRRDGDVYGSIDFNKLIPMPKSLNVTDGSITSSAVSAFLSALWNDCTQNPTHPEKKGTLARYADAAKLMKGGSFLQKPFDYLTEAQIAGSAERHKMSVPDFLELGKAYLDNQLTHGAATWYKWCTSHWGTKWNVSEGCHLQNGNVLHFDTAWSAPAPILQALSQKFPTVEFDHAWADEDLGQNVGRCAYLDGKVTYMDIPVPGSASAYELAFSILERDPEDENLYYNESTGTYEYGRSEERTPAPKAPSIDAKIDLAKVKSLLGATQAQNTPNKGEPER